VEERARARARERERERVARVRERTGETRMRGREASGIPPSRERFQLGLLLLLPPRMPMPPFVLETE
jgi:hypothetical protein